MMQKGIVFIGLIELLLSPFLINIVQEIPRYGMTGRVHLNAPRYLSSSE
jgi:hypothetical protein